MKTSLAPILLTAIAITAASCSKQDAKPAPTPTPPPPAAPAPAAAQLVPARQTSFGEVTRQLDAGGSVYAYLATDQWLAGLSTNLAQLRELVENLPGISGTEQENVQRGFDLATRAVAGSGIENLTGVGISGVQLTSELHRTKLILHHAKGQGDGLLWNLLGAKPHALNGLTWLPTNTAVAAYGDLDVPALWHAIETGLGQSEIPEAAEAVQKWPELFEQQTKMSWPKLLSSLGGEFGFVLTLDEAHRIRLPLGEQAFELPEPGLMFMVKVNDDLLYDRVSTELKRNTQTVIADEKDLKMCALPIPLPLPMELQITVASSGGYFFVASSPQLVRNALAVHAGSQPGLRQSAEFAALLKYLPTEGNQFGYADRRFSATLLELQRQALRAHDEFDSKEVDLIQKLLMHGGPNYGLSIGAHTETGWQSVAVGNRDSATALLAAPVVPAVAVVAAMTLPALAKAKERAQSISCINNMKQIGLAFRMWSLDNGDHFPFNVSTAQGGTLEFCDRSADGYDFKSFRHLQVMSNELSTPKILVCPGDPSRQAARDFAGLTAANVTYQVRSGTNVDETRPTEVITFCPIHRHLGYADGSVQAGRK